MGRMTLVDRAMPVDPRASVEEMEQMELEGELEQSDELRRTRVWRLDQFVALGFDDARAELMAEDSQVELGLARRLITLGCPLETAARILL
jgi:hypothetical protein